MNLNGNVTLILNVDGKVFNAVLRNGRLSLTANDDSLQALGQSLTEHVLSWQSGDTRTYGDMVRHIDRLETCVEA